MDRAYALLTVKTVEEGEQRVIKGVATTPTPDRVGDIVEPLGVTFRNPLPLLHQHDHDRPVGNVVFEKPTKSGIKFTARLPQIDEPGPLKDRVDTAWGEVKAGLVRAVSIGFRTLKHAYLDSGGVHFLETEVLELSLVTVPANADATITAVKSIDRSLRAASGKAQGGSSTAPALGQSSNAHGRTGAMSYHADYADKIAAIEEEITPKRARMDQIMKAALDDGDRPLSEAEAEEFDGLAAEVKDLGQRLDRLKAVASARPVDGSSVERAAASRRRQQPAVTAVTDPTPKKEADGLGFARFAMCLAAAKGDPLRAVEVAKHRYPGLHPLTSMLKAAVAGHTTVATDSGSALVDPENYMGDFIEYLRPRTIIGRFGSGGIPSLRRVPFNIKVPAQLSAGDAYWTGEARGKGVTQFNFGTITLRWTKAANIAVVSEELLRFSTPSAEMLVRDALVEALQARLDADFVSPSVTAIADVRPAAITVGAQAYAATGPTADDFRVDLKRLLSYFVTNNIGSSSNVFIMRDAQAISLSLMTNALGQPEFPTVTREGGTLLGIPVITSQHVPAGIIVLANASEVYLADDGQVSVDISREASLEMDSTPTNTPSSITASPPTPAGASLVSMWQTNSVAIRAERYINWRRRHDAGVVYLTGASYGSPDTSPPAAPI